MPISTCVLVLTTLPADHDVEALARRLVDERLAACVNLLPPMRSVYRWRGAVEAADERQVLIKTLASRVPALERRLRELHPYDIPEFVVLPITGGGQAYLDWVAESVEG
jgi:periplasmic divalent cation tolerance protein